jgi:hypothetical protein
MAHVETTQADAMPVLSAKEKAEFLRSLEEAQAQIERGEGIVFEKRGDFTRWMEDCLAQHKASRSA